MRKIKLLTLLAMMLGSVVTTQAQEKQNDATWEETIEFINENIGFIDHREATTIDNKLLVIKNFYQTVFYFKNGSSLLISWSRFGKYALTEVLS